MARNLRWRNRDLTTARSIVIPSCRPSWYCSCSPPKVLHLGGAQLPVLSLCQPSLCIALLVLLCLCILALLLSNLWCRRSPRSAHASPLSKRRTRRPGDFSSFVSGVPHWARISGLLRALALGSKAALDDVTGLRSCVDDFMFGSGRFFVAFHPPSTVLLQDKEQAGEHMGRAGSQETTPDVEAVVERALPRTALTGSLGSSALWVREGRTSRMRAYAKLVGFGTMSEWLAFESHILRIVGHVCEDRPALTVPFREVRAALPALAACGPFDMSSGDVLSAHAACSIRLAGGPPLRIAEVLIHFPLRATKFAASYPSTWAVLKKVFGQLTVSAAAARNASAGGSDSLPLLGTACISSTGLEMRFRMSDGHLVVGGSHETGGGNRSPGAASLEKRPWLAPGCAPATILQWDPRPGFELQISVRLNAQVGSLLQLGLPAFVAPTVRLAATLSIVDERPHPGGKQGRDTVGGKGASRSGGNRQRLHVGRLVDDALDAEAVGAVIEVRLAEIGTFFGERFFSRLFPIGALRVSVPRLALPPLLPAPSLDFGMRLIRSRSVTRHALALRICCSRRCAFGLPYRARAR
jgi:hypothetical protein